MSQSVSRQQRRKMERDLKKQGKLSDTHQAATPAGVPDSNNVTQQEMQHLVKDMQKVLNYTKIVDNHMWMLVETLDRKGILNWSDVNETEALYSQKEKTKQEKIKLLLEQDLSISEALEAIREDTELPGYKKYDINPIKDLNMNPYEVGVYLRDANPNLTQEQYLDLGKAWEMTLDHFGFNLK